MEAKTRTAVFNIPLFFKEENLTLREVRARARLTLTPGLYALAPIAIFQYFLSQFTVKQQIRVNLNGRTSLNSSKNVSN